MRKTFMAMAAVATLTAGALGGCSALGQQLFKEPVVSLRDVKITGVGLTSASLDFYLGVYNPNGYTLDASRLTYTLNVEDTQLATGALDGAFAVQEQDSTVVRVPVTFSFSGVGAAARQLINSGAVNYRVSGDVAVRTPLGNYTVPYRSTGRYTAFGGNR
jgi:LEA14-like dessication related protein